jgi:dTDP-glucose 4,6-dehydratase
MSHPFCASQILVANRSASQKQRQSELAMKVRVTAGAGFIGSAVCRLFVGELSVSVLNVDKLTYVANLASLRAIEASPGYAFHKPISAIEK